MVRFIRLRKKMSFIILSVVVVITLPLLPVFHISDLSRKSVSVSRKIYSSRKEFYKRVIQERLKYSKAKSQRNSYDIKNKTVNDQNDLDILRLGPFTFLKNYKNPCFYYNSSVDGQCIRCLPYFFIIGMPKCGTSDLWTGLTLNRFTALQQSKEPMYFNKRRFKDWTFENYLNHFLPSVSKINKHYTVWNKTSGEKYYNFITGDGSVDTSHDNDHWWQLPENRDCKEPCYVNYHYLYHLNPNLKVIFMLRNPIHRLYSDYLYESRFLGYNTSLEGFHKAVTKAIKNYWHCWKFFTKRACAYNGSLETYQARLRIGMYHIFLEDLYNVFPKRQIIVINFEEYAEHNLHVTKKVYGFLGLDQNLTFTEESRLLRRHIEKQQYKESGMLRRTEKILMEFYEPFNNNIAMFLNDEKYLQWNTYSPVEYKRKKISRNFITE